MNKNTISGIYKIVNTKTNKYYIGSAISVSKRLATHKHQLINNKHFNKHLQYSWNKYGGKYFNFDLIEECSKDNLLNREEYYINLFKSNIPEFGFNVRVDCKTNLGVIPSDDTRLKMSLAKLNKKRPESTRLKIVAAKYKPIYQIDFETLEIINTFNSIKEAEEYNINILCSRSISLCAKGKMLSHPKNKYHWCFVKDYIDKNTYVNYINEVNKVKGKWKKIKGYCSS